ncbi:MAG: metallophosphoesterase [Acidobacteriota bacterium]|nr:metallophosphoesterase [Acidobacteriota bacterium]
MRKIVHISDVHFGRIDYAVVKSLRGKIVEIAPDLIVVSGDLTQRAKSAEFVEAKEFLDSLPPPQIVVPGNHDVPMYNVFDRFLNPLEKYKKYITEDLEPFYADDEIAVAGINTARSLTIKDGRINAEQIASVRRKMCGLPDEILKIIVTHHPFDLPENHTVESDIVENAASAMQAFADCGADVFLSGHLHISSISETASRYKLASGRSALVVQAGTATSTRGRGEANSFNVLEFNAPNLAVKRFECENSADGFAEAQIKHYEQYEKGWRKVAQIETKEN